MVGCATPMPWIDGAFFFEKLWARVDHAFVLRGLRRPIGMSLWSTVLGMTYDNVVRLRDNIIDYIRLTRILPLPPLFPGPKGEQCDGIVPLFWHNEFSHLVFRNLTVADQISVSNVCRTLHQAVGLHFQSHIRSSNSITDYKCCKPPIPELQLRFDLSVDSSIEYYFRHVFDETDWHRCQIWYEDMARYDLPLLARVEKNQNKKKRRELHRNLVRDFRRR